MLVHVELVMAPVPGIVGLVGKVCVKTAMTIPMLTTMMRNTMRVVLLFLTLLTRLMQVLL